ncbi:MAG: CRTAC1 family protein, partial [Deltaproteobacteria bacterium]|nr:CRTAC1 family protein [Deltaproteobacteria bacterium]
WGDFDNDGFLDFYATVNSLTEHDLLYRNNGDGTFSDVSDPAGKPYDLLPSEAAAWGDVDGDGFIDLYVANYELPGEELGKATDDYLWKNNGGVTFSDYSEQSGIRKWGKYCGRGVNMGDFNDDGWIDIYVSNYRLNPNFLWQNDGDGTFSEVAFLKGVAGIGLQFAYGHTIGSVWGDIDRDGDLDLFAANLAHPRFITFSDKSMLYMNSGAPDYKFKDMREEAGIAYQETHSEPVLFDFDNDSLLDLFITCVYVGRESAFYTNEGDTKFEEESYLSGLYVENGWGAAAADINNDGLVDIAANRIFINKYDKAGNFLKVKLEGVKTNRAAIGARVTVIAGDKTLISEVEGGKGTGNQNSLTLHFGLGGAAA